MGTGSRGGRCFPRCRHSCSYGVTLGYKETDLCVGDIEGGFGGRNKEILEGERTGGLAL